MKVQKPATAAAMRMAKVRGPEAAFIWRGTKWGRGLACGPCYAWLCARALWAAAGGGRPPDAWLEAERGARQRERRAGRVRGIHRRPVETAEIVTLLLPRHIGIGVGGVGLPRADAPDAGVEAGGEEQAVERGGAGGCADRVALLGARIDRVGDGRMAGGEHTPRLVRDRRIDPRRRLRAVGVRRQALGLGDAAEAFALDVAAQHHRAR